MRIAICEDEKVVLDFESSLVTQWAAGAGCPLELDTYISAEQFLFESEDKDAFERFSQTGAYANAYTSFDRTCYLFSCAGKFKENLEDTVDQINAALENQLDLIAEKF